MCTLKFLYCGTSQISLPTYTVLLKIILLKLESLSNRESSRSIALHTGEILLLCRSTSYGCDSQDSKSTFRLLVVISSVLKLC